MRTKVGVLLASTVLIAAGCTSGDRSVAPASSTTIDDSPSIGTALPEVTLPSSAPEPGAEDGPVATDTPLSTPDTPSTTASASGAGGVAAPTDEGGESLGPLGETDVEVETDEGLVQIGDADVPASLDDSFPLPDDLVVQLASETATDLGFSGTTPWSIEELTEFYAGGLPEAGYEITGTQLVKGVFAVFTFESQNRFGQVAISETPGDDSSTVLVTVGDGAGREADVQG